MSPDEYNELAVRLTQQLNQKGTLIEFVVCDAATYSLGDRRPIDTIELWHFAIEWRIPFRSRALTGSYLFPVETIIDAPDVDMAEIIINLIIPEITWAILHPDEVPKAKIGVT